MNGRNKVGSFHILLSLKAHQRDNNVMVMM